MSSKHTPGPWVVTPHPMTNVDVSAVGVIMDDKEMQYGLSHTICYQNAEANARLIAAAPELLEALKQCIQLAWEDSREISFDSTVQLGVGYDFDGVDKFRMEVHTPIGSWMVWPSGYKYSVYRDNGDMWFEQFDSRADAEELVLSCIDRLCPTFPTAVAHAAIAKATDGAQ
ncbi:hypothetical protein [Stenotrophomonas maltophilia]|uniref:hypothetical protein n=1 Tax=Stenotrophomonas maltophilia TaxID=40324 RepID=UPI00156259FA|nr:hypothetical protein [Stenotrophomonas maltophilia]NRP03264.1 hypothetical protein [Stenotrophomonas maltophilia]